MVAGQTDEERVMAGSAMTVADATCVGRAGRLVGRRQVPRADQAGVAPATRCRFKVVASSGSLRAMTEYCGELEAARRWIEEKRGQIFKA